VAISIYSWCVGILLGPHNVYPSTWKLGPISQPRVPHWCFCSTHFFTRLKNNVSYFLLIANTFVLHFVQVFVLTLVHSKQTLFGFTA
jgi:hypothetical protein